MQQSRRHKVIEFLVIPLIIFINFGWITLAFIDNETAILLTREDRFLQWMQFIFLMLTSFYLLRIILKDNTNYENKLVKPCFSIFLILTLGLAFEEISWGQRIFNIATPESIMKLNVQEEISLHNLWFFQRFRHWLLLAFGVIGLLLIYSKMSNNVKLARVSFLYPPAFFKISFFLVLISGLCLEAAYISLSIFPGEIAKLFRFWAGRYSEIGELGVSITALSYAAYKYNSFAVK